MTLSRLEAMKSYWQTNPPMHQLLKWYVGYKAPDSAKEIDDASLDVFMAEIATLNGG